MMNLLTLLGYTIFFGGLTYVCIAIGIMLIRTWNVIKNEGKGPYDPI